MMVKNIKNKYIQAHSKMKDFKKFVDHPFLDAF